MGAQFLGWLFDLMSAESITIAHGSMSLIFLRLTGCGTACQSSRGLTQHVDVYQS